jgi:hypothetical protein
MLEAKPITLQLNESARMHTERVEKKTKVKQEERNTIVSLLLS